MQVNFNRSDYISPFSYRNEVFHYYDLSKLEKQGIAEISSLPFCIRILLESALRNCDGKKITKEDVFHIAHFTSNQNNRPEVPFVVSRIVLQDFTGVPLLVDLAAMRSAVAARGKDPKCIEPLVPVDLVIDHSIQVDAYADEKAFSINLQKEFERNAERYSFLKWGQKAFKNVNIVPPGIGIVHQVNLEYLAQMVFRQDTPQGPLLYPDSLVGTDSHTTMINGLGLVGWGVGGIEAQGSMLGQPLYFQLPQVVGVYLTGKLPEGATATDLTLAITHILRKAGVVGKFLEFFGPGTKDLSVPDRATIANMAPEYGATVAYFGVDEQTLRYLIATGRSEERVGLVENYYKAQGLFGIPDKGCIQYDEVIQLDLGTIVPCIAGPKRPQDLIPLSRVRDQFQKVLYSPISQNGFGKHKDDIDLGFRGNFHPSDKNQESSIKTGSIVLAAITSCTNTSNPAVMIAAGLLAKKACQRGLTPPPHIKTSLAPGSRVVTQYLEQAGLQEYLNKLGFHLVGYGCTTCIGNSGPLAPWLERVIKDNNVIVASVLSGNRNFEARIHPSIKANFLMSAPLVVAFALAGTVLINLESDPLGYDPQGHPVYLKDIWPSSEEIQHCMQAVIKPEIFRDKYASINIPEWDAIPISSSLLYDWQKNSTYIQEPPFFQQCNLEDLDTISYIPPPLTNARPLLILGDSVSTDHISPAGSIAAEGPAGLYLQSKGVLPQDFNSFGARRGNDQVMLRGTFSNSRLKNLMAPSIEGGITLLMPDRKLMSVYDASQAYREQNTPLLIIAGKDYGMGSSRDWAAKGTSLLGVKAVLAVSFERIHRSNLIGMGILPVEFLDNQTPQTLGLQGIERYTLAFDPPLTKFEPGQYFSLTIDAPDIPPLIIKVRSRLDTPIEVVYYLNGGILPYMLKNLVTQTNDQ